MGLEREWIGERVRPIRFEMVDENSSPRGGGNKWRATMGGLASDSRPWLDQFRKRDKERDCKGFSSGKKNLYSLFLIQRKKGEEEKKL